ncbi:ROK family transcriptional regulator [Jiella mangrovi]|uniref:ROK family transcriptional regulator n=1 Tax=Jiella mangrovi TaxID=2821407 RepID=UPI001FD8119A|nr:ROK family transcriptional regulator [Jiella mangrovi]
MSRLAKTDADMVRVHNRLAVLDHLRRVGVTTRKAVSEATGLSVSAASAICGTLLRSGLLEEVEEDGRSIRRGRPGKSLAFRGGAARVAALKIAVGEISGRISDYAGAPLAEARREVDISGQTGDTLVVLLGDLAEDLLARTIEPGTGEGGAGDAPMKIDKVVVAIQGKTHSDLSGIVWSPALKHWNIGIAAPLSERLLADVSVLNDCSLMPEAFRWRPDFIGLDFATLFVGFGVGMGLRLNGSTFQGKHSSAVEFGHINHLPGGALCRCGNRGCVEAYAGDYAILRRATGSDEIPAHRIADETMLRLGDAARQGDEAARTAFEEAGNAIGYGLGRVFTMIDPLPIVMTGSGARAIDLLEPAIRNGIRESAVDGLGADAPLILMEDTDALVYDAGTAYGLAALDGEFSRSAVEATEAA